MILIGNVFFLVFDCHTLQYNDHQSMVCFCQRISQCNEYKVHLHLNQFFEILPLDHRWSELYFIFWYLVITTIGLNICLALSGDVSKIEILVID